MDAQRGLSVSGHRNTVLCLHLTSDTYHVTPSGRAPRARGKFWIRRVKLRIFRPDPKSHKSEGFPAAQIFKTHKCQNTYCRSAHFSKAVKFVGAQNPRGTTWSRVDEQPSAHACCTGSSRHDFTKSSYDGWLGRPNKEFHQKGLAAMQRHYTTSYFTRPFFRDLSSVYGLASSSEI